MPKLPPRKGRAPADRLLRQATHAVIADAGGVNALAERLDVAPSTLSRFKAAGQIPAHHIATVVLAANERLGERRWTTAMLLPAPRRVGGA